MYKKYYKNVLALVFLLAMLSCNPNKKEIELQSCLDANIKRDSNSFYFKKAKEIYEKLYAIEAFLHNKEHIKNLNSKSSYSEFIYGLIDAKYDFNALNNELKGEFGDQYLELIPNISYHILMNCPKYVLITGKNEYDSTLNLQREIIEKVEYYRFKDKSSIKELFDATKAEDFKDRIYRIPFIYAILFNIANNT